MTDPSTDYIDPTSNPALANASIAAVLNDEPQEIPSISFPRDGLVELPGGLQSDGGLIREVEVQELTGAHEERLVKVRSTGDPARYLRALLNSGVVAIGGLKPTDEMLDDLLVGDREYLVLMIREATYGPEIEMGAMSCDTCGESFDLILETNEIPIRPLEGERQFTIPLRKGGHATVRLPNGADQEAYLRETSASDSERNSILLSRCVLTITDPSGDEEVVAGSIPMVRDGLGIVDRRSILKAINERQPGPRYDEVKYTHDCGNKMTLGVGLMHLFPGL